jgi:chromosome segregation ATPase
LRRDAAIAAANAANTGSFAFGRYRSGEDDDDAGPSSNVGSSSKPTPPAERPRGVTFGEDDVAFVSRANASRTPTMMDGGSKEYPSSPDMKVRLSAAMEALRNVRVELEEKETSLGDQLAESRAMLMIADQDLEEARRSNGELTRDSEDAKGRADALRKALTDALAKIEAHAREAAVATAAAARLSQAEESSGRVEAENQKLREALDQAESRLADAERARVDAETAVEKHADSVRDVEGELDAAHAEIDARVTRERELADQIESLCEALLINEGKTVGGSGVDGAMSVEVARLRQELRKSEQVLRDASSRAETGGFKRAEYLAAIEERAAGAERERDRLQSMMSPMRDELERLTAIVNEQNTSVDRASAARERDVLLAELESQKDVVREAMAMNATARASGGVLDLEKLEEELRAAEAALVSSRAAEQVASIEAEAARADAAKRVENEREAARREQERLAKEHEAMGQKLGETRADAAESSRRADDLAARVQSLEARCSQAEAARDEASARFAAAAEGETNLAARLKAVEAAAAAREAELAEHLKTAKMTKLMYRWRNQSTSHAFMSWRDNVSEIKRTMRVVEKVAGRWRRLQLSVPFNDWLDVVAAAKEERTRRRLEETEAGAETSKREAAEFRTQAERLVSELSELKRRGADAEAALERAKIDGEDAAKMIATLEAEKEERDRARTVEAEAGENNIRYLANQLKTAEKDASSLKQAVRDAAADVESSAAELERAKAAAAEREAELGRRLQTAEKDSSALKLAVRDATSKFDDAAAELERLKAASVIREKQLAEDLKTAKMTKLMYRWRNQSTSHAFMSWRDNVREIKRTRRIVEKVAARWQRMELSVPFTRWVEWVRDVVDARRDEELERTKDDADTIRFEAEKLVTELGKFKAKARDAEESAAANEKLAQDAAAEIEKRRMSADAAEESMFKELERRKAVADESKREVKKLKQDVRALHETIATLETAEREAVERFAAAAANETKIAKALRDANEAAEARESELSEELRFAKLARMVHRWRNQSASRSFAAWRQNAREIARQRRAIAKVATRWNRLALAIPFEDWVEHVDAARAKRRESEAAEQTTQAERLVEELAAASARAARLEEDAAELRRRCDVMDGREAEMKRLTDTAMRDAAAARTAAERLEKELTEVRAKLRRSENAQRIDATLGGGDPRRHTMHAPGVASPAPGVGSPAPHADSDTDSDFSESEASVPGPRTTPGAPAATSPSSEAGTAAMVSDSVTSWTPFRLPARPGVSGRDKWDAGGALAIRFAVFAAWIAAATAFVICVAASFYLGDDASDGDACSRGRGVVAWTAGMLDELLSGTVRARYRPACGLAMRPS